MANNQVVPDAVATARVANDHRRWDALWSAEGHDSWRGKTLDLVYERIEQLLGRRLRSVLDVGGGVGILAKRLSDLGHHVQVLDHSEAALQLAQSLGFTTHCVDLEKEFSIVRPKHQDDRPSVLIATEVMEHLSPAAFQRVVATAKQFDGAIFSVPNDRLGPEEEPQHTRKWTALELLTELRTHWPDARVEVVGPDKSDGVGAFLLGVCGFGKKTYTLSMTMPVRNEAADIESVLATFRGACDEIVIGVDPRTTDNTREIAAKYAEVVFDIVNPRGPNPEENKVPENGVNFSFIRNQCIDKCSSQWIFMTEGHERLKSGLDVLLNISEDSARRAHVIWVWRTGGKQRWGYPWMFKKDSRIRFNRATHNKLTYPDGLLELKLPQVQTYHFRDHKNAEQRAKQRKSQNRLSLFDDWRLNRSVESLYYFSSEMREYDPARAVEYMEEYLRQPAKNGPARYQVRLQLALEYAHNMDGKKAREVLIRAFEDDWSRVEHIVWLGDLAAEEEQWEQALQWYEYAATRIGQAPFSSWWVDDDMYSYLPAQRLAMAYSAVGNAENALHWARKVKELLPEDSPVEVIAEADENIRILEEAEP